MADKHQGFYAAIGRAVTGWLDVEKRLAEIFVAFNQPKDQEVTIEAYYAIVNFVARRAMVERMAHKVLARPFGDDLPLLKTWEKLSNRIGKHVKRRNAIVHGAIIEDATSDKLVPILVGPDADMSEIIAALATPRTPGQTKGTSVFRTKELIETEKLFKELNLDLKYFRDDLCAELGISLTLQTLFGR